MSKIQYIEIILVTVVVMLLISMFNFIFNTYTLNKAIQSHTKELNKKFEEIEYVINVHKETE